MKRLVFAIVLIFFVTACGKDYDMQDIRSYTEVEGESEDNAALLTVKLDTSNGMRLDEDFKEDENTAVIITEEGDKAYVYVESGDMWEFYQKSLTNNSFELMGVSVISSDEKQITGSAEFEEGTIYLAFVYVNENAIAEIQTFSSLEQLENILNNISFE